jgi:hypothetical protein
MILVVFLLALSLTVNGLLVWYTRKLVNNLKIGVNGVEQFQQLLDEYCKSMESVYELEKYYGDETITAVINNTKMVIEASKFYKNAVLEIEEEANIENSEQQAG